MVIMLSLLVILRFVIVAVALSTEHVKRSVSTKMIVSILDSFFLIDEGCVCALLRIISNEFVNMSLEKHA